MSPIFNTFVSLNIHSSAIPYRWRKWHKGKEELERLGCPCPGGSGVSQIPALCPCTNSHHSLEKKHHQPEFLELSENGRDLKDHQFAVPPFLIPWVFQREVKTPTVFAWRVEEWYAQKIHVCSQTPSGRLLGKVLGLVFRTIKYIYERHVQSFPLGWL